MRLSTAFNFMDENRIRGLTPSVGIERVYLINSAGILSEIAG